MIRVSPEGAGVETAVAAISQAEPLHLLQSCSTSRPYRGRVEINVAAPDAKKVLPFGGHDMPIDVAAVKPHHLVVRQSRGEL